MLHLLRPRVTPSALLIDIMSKSRAENTAANTNLGTLSTIDADAGDTFTYTLVNNTAAYFDL